MVLTPSICRRPRRIDLAVFSDIASLQSDPLRGREPQSLVEGVTKGAPEIKAHCVRTGCKKLIDPSPERGNVQSMKALRLFLVGLLIAATSLFAASVANAGQLSTAGASISWDDSTFYEPSSCTSYLFTYTATNKVLFADIKITNKFNDEVGGTIFFGPNSGKASVQVCTGKDLSGAKVVLKVTGSASYGGTDDIVSTPITFLSRSGAPSTTPAPTVTVTATPAPAPTVTVTATPAPAPTVYITNPSDKNLTDLVSSLKSQVSLLNAKVKRICAIKPKPKGC